MRARAADVRALIASRLARFVFLTLFTTGGRIPDLFYRSRNLDEAAAMAEAWAMSLGSVLYRDIPQIHPPLNFLIFVPLFKTLPPSMVPHVAKAVNMVIAIFCVWVVAEIVARITGDLFLALLAGVLVSYHLSEAFSWAMASFGEFYIILPLGIAVLLLFSSARWTPGRRELVAGTLLATAIWFKQVALIDAVVISGSYAFVMKSGLPARVRALGNITAGVLIVNMLGLGWLYINGALRAAIVCMEPLFTGRYMLHGGAAAQPAMRIAATTFWLEIVTMAIGVAALAFHTLRSREMPRLWIVTVCWAGVLAAVFLTFSRFYDHYLLQLVVPMSLAASIALCALRTRLRNAIAVVAIVMAVFTTMRYSINQLRYLHGVGWESWQERRADKVADYVRSHTSPTDTIFLFGVLDLDIFYLSQRRSNNEIYMSVDMFAEHIGSDAVAQRAQARFYANLPKAIVIDPKPTYFSTIGSGFIHDVIASRYALASTIAGIQIYLRR